MRQVSVHEIDHVPGLAYDWRMRISGEPVDAGPTSYNQTRHLAADQRPTFYLAGTFELPGPLNLEALESALLHLIQRHEVLRTRYEGNRYRLYGSDQIELHREGPLPLDSTLEVQAHLHDQFRTVDESLVAMGAVARPDSATVYLAFDHLVSDIMTITLAAHDITVAYEAFSRGATPSLPATGSFLEYSRQELQDNQALDASHPSLDPWRHHRPYFPPFPLDLGVQEGVKRPAEHLTVPLLDPAGTTALENRSRSVMAGLLASVALATRELTDLAEYRAVMPWQQRGSEYAHALGWFVDVAPVRIPVPPGTGFSEALTHARSAFARPQVHYLRAWELLSPDLSTTGGYAPVNYFSYLDFRHLPGRAKVHLWAAATSAVFTWFYRDESGLHVSWLHPSTPQATHSIRELSDAIRETLRANSS